MDTRPPRLLVFSVVVALLLAAVALAVALQPESQKLNIYAPIKTCRAAPGTPARRGAEVLDFATRDLSGPPFYGVCNVPLTPTPWIVGRPVRLDGDTEVSVEFYLAASEPDVDSSVVAYLYDGARKLGALTDSSTLNLQGGARIATTMYARIYLTPRRGRHVFKIALGSVDGTSNPVYSGAGTTPGAVSPWIVSYYRVARA